MSLIHLALLTKAIEEQQKRTGAKRSTKKEETKKDYQYESDNTVGIETFLEDLLENDPEATKLFLLLKDCKKQIDEEDNQKSLEAVQEVCKEYDEQDQILQTEIKNLEEIGITLDNTLLVEKFRRSVKVEEGRGFGGYGTYSYNPGIYQMGFNGMPLTREMIETNTNQFQIDLDKFNKENPNLDEQLTEISTKITKQKKNLKYSPFNKSKKQSLLTEMLNVEKKLLLEIEKRTTLEKQSKAFSSLSEKQKKAILAYMDQVANCIVIGEKISNTINASIAINKNFYGNKTNEDRNVHQRMLQKATEQGDLTIEEIESILARIKSTTEENKVGFGRYNRISEKTYTVYPTSPESMFAAEYYDSFYIDKTITKK